MVDLTPRKPPKQLFNTRHPMIIFNCHTISMKNIYNLKNILIVSEFWFTVYTKKITLSKSIVFVCLCTSSWTITIYLFMFQ